MTKKKEKSMFQKKVLGVPTAKIKGIDAISVLTPTENIALVRSAEQVEPRRFEEPRSLFFTNEFNTEKKKMGGFI